MKEWVIGNHNNINLHVHNKVIVKSCVHLYNEFWKRRCVVLHYLEVQKNMLKEEALVIMEESSKYEIEGSRRHVKIYKINSNKVSAEQLL